MKVKHYYIEQIDREYYIFMEDMRDGNLAQKIKKNKYLQPNTVRIYTAQILRGLEYLHCIKKIIHRDIKPENILLSGSGKIKLSDFGEAKFLEESTGTIKGTIAYMAPEIANVGKKDLILI
jgi:serine/threonine protein kinase